jgi:arylformamidase
VLCGVAALAGRYDVAVPKLVDLSHVITDGMTTYPGLPVPVVDDHLTREAAETIYGPGITFQIGVVTMCTNTGTYLDVPFHRFADGHDLTELALERVAAVPAVCLDRRGQNTIDLTDEELIGMAGYAVLIHTGHAEHWGTDAYFVDHPHLSEEAANALVRVGVACVGVDTLNIDSTEGGERPVHTVLLGSEIPIIEHLVNLEQLPSSGFTFTAVPPKIKGAGTFTVRAFASV